MKGFRRVSGINWLTDIGEPLNADIFIDNDGKKEAYIHDHFERITLPNHWERVKNILLWIKSA